MQQQENRITLEAGLSIEHSYGTDLKSGMPDRCHISIVLSELMGVANGRRVPNEKERASAAAPIIPLTMCLRV